MKPTKPAAQSMSIFTDLEANLATDTDGSLLLQLHTYLEQTSQVKISCLSRKQASKIDSSFTHES